jgi:hypothetical protein
MPAVPLDGGFGSDLEGIISHREPLNSPAWD